jgi:choline monooxygenase
VYTSEETYRSTRVPVERARTLIREAYVCEEFFSLERERVFASGWVAAGCADALRQGGQALVTEVGGRSIVILRGADGQLRAFYNSCRHRGTQLLEPGCHRLGRFIRCPYHSWAYDHQGRCVGTPLFAGSPIPEDQQEMFNTDSAEHFDRADHGLLEVAVAQFGPVLLVNLSEAPTPLQEHLGDLPQRLAGYQLERWTTARSRTYEIAANHKLVAENFMEYYHLPWVHPELIQVSPMEAHHRWQGRGMYCGMCTSPIAANTSAGGWQGLPALEGLDGEDAISARFIWLFPNVALNVLPNHVFMIQLQPRGPRHTAETTHLLVDPDVRERPDQQAAIDQLAAFWDRVNREDIRIVERVQRGLDSTPFPGGPMCYRFEEPLHRFQNMIIDRMVGVDRVPGGDEDLVAAAQTQ